MNMLPVIHGKIYQIEVTIINDGGSGKYVITLIYSEYICTMNMLMLVRMKTLILLYNVKRISWYPVSTYIVIYLACNK